MPIDIGNIPMYKAYFHGGRMARVYGVIAWLVVCYALAPSKAKAAAYLVLIVLLVGTVGLVLIGIGFIRAGLRRML